MGSVFRGSLIHLYAQSESFARRERMHVKMFLNSAVASAMAVPRRPSLRPVCLGSNINSEQLRAQLDQLHSEAESTRAKANSARLRLLRLSDAAEKLQRQAAISLETGKDNDARQLLFQKKKIMLALEKSKSRIELLDELLAKLNEAISLKETQLVGNVSLTLGTSGDDAPITVRIISPNQESSEDLNEKKEFEPNVQKLDDSEDSQLSSKHRESQPVGKEPEDLEASMSVGIQNEDDTASSFFGMKSYEDFLELLDQELGNIEAELLTILRVSTLVLDSKDTRKNSKVQETLELLEGIRGIRKRISRIRRTEAETK